MRARGDIPGISSTGKGLQSSRNNSYFLISYCGFVFSVTDRAVREGVVMLICRCRGEGKPLCWRERCFPSPRTPHPFPSALLSGKSQEYEATPPPKTSGVCTASLSYLFKLFVKFVLVGPGRLRSLTGIDSRDEVLPFPRKNDSGTIMPFVPRRRSCGAAGRGSGDPRRCRFRQRFRVQEFLP